MNTLFKLIVIAAVLGLAWNSLLGFTSAQSDIAPSPDELRKQMNIDDWHTEGYDGTDIPIGVMSSAFPTEARISALIDTSIIPHPDQSSLMGNDDTNIHSPEIAETLYTLNVFAPGSTIYFYWVEDAVDYPIALEWFKTQGVRIIVNLAMYPRYTQPYLDSYIESADINSDEFLWLFPAGNYGGQFYESQDGIDPFIPRLSVPQHNFDTTPDTPLMELVASEDVSSAHPFILQMAWDTPPDFDMQLLHEMVQVNVYRARGEACTDTEVLQTANGKSLGELWYADFPNYLAARFEAVNPGDRICIELIAGPQENNPVFVLPFRIFVDNATILNSNFENMEGNSIPAPNAPPASPSNNKLTVGALNAQANEIASYTSQDYANGKPEIYTYGTVSIPEYAENLSGTRFSVAIIAGIAATYWDRYDNEKTSAGIRAMLLADSDGQKVYLEAQSLTREPPPNYPYLKLAVAAILIAVLGWILRIRDKRNVLKRLPTPADVRAICHPTHKTLQIEIPFQVRSGKKNALEIARYFRVLEIHIGLSPAQSHLMPEQVVVVPKGSDIDHTVGKGWSLSFQDFGIKRETVEIIKLKAVEIYTDTSTIVTKIRLESRFALEVTGPSQRFTITFRDLSTCPEKVDITLKLGKKDYTIFSDAVEIQPPLSNEPEIPTVKMESTPHNIFLSYRRADTPTETRMLYDKLGDVGFSVFMDVKGIPGGKNWETTIETKLLRTDFALVIIGPRWLTITDEKTGETRLGQKNDMVHKEVRLALRYQKHGVTVIPILIGDTPMPSIGQLPRGIKSLAGLQAIRIRCDDDFQTDCDKLIKHIRSQV